MSRLSTNSALLFAVSLCCGCGGDQFPLAPVKGVLTLDGKPVAGAQVRFEPKRAGKQIAAGPGSYAMTDADGRFELRTADGRLGAVIGEHRVAFSTYEAKQGENFEPVTVVEERIPTGYQGDDPNFTFVVPADGDESADFSLTSNGDQ